MPQQVPDLGWVDFDFCCSTVCPIVLGLMKDGLNGQSSYIVKMSETSESKSTQPSLETWWDTLYVCMIKTKNSNRRMSRDDVPPF